MIIILSQKNWQISLSRNASVLSKIQRNIISFFFIPIKKEITKINKDGNEGVVTVSYKIKGFMVTSLLSLVDNLTEGLHKS